MQLRFWERATLPALAWTLRLQCGSEEAVLAHGDKVEVGPDFFVEGAWNGPFAEVGFDSAFTFSGSGARLDEDGVLLCSSSSCQ